MLDGIQDKTQDKTKWPKTNPRQEKYKIPLSWVTQDKTQDKNFLYLSCLGFVLGQPVLSWVLSWVRFFEKFLSCLGLVLGLVIWSRNSICTRAIRAKTIRLNLQKVNILIVKFISLDALLFSELPLRKSINFKKFYAYQESIIF